MEQRQKLRKAGASSVQHLAGEHTAKTVISSPKMPVRTCVVSFVDARGIRHGTDVEAESLFEAAVIGITRLNHDPWIERIGPATQLEIEVREPATVHRLSMQQVERWLAGATPNPTEATKKAKLKMMLVQRATSDRSG